MDIEANRLKTACLNIFSEFVITHSNFDSPSKGTVNFVNVVSLGEKGRAAMRGPQLFSRIADLQGSKPKTSQSPDCACRMRERSDIDWPKLDINEKNFGQRDL